MQPSYWKSLHRALVSVHPVHCALKIILNALTGPDCALTQEDREALLDVMPSARVFDSSFTFYIHASEMFKNQLLVYYEVLFAQLAISTAPANIDTSSLWYTVIKGYLDLGRYDDAYAALMATPHERQLVFCPCFLASVMLIQNTLQEKRMCQPTDLPDVRERRYRYLHVF
jgi:hypothetical protein